MLFANLVDFDQLFGHRNDAAGFYGALREFDAALPSMLSALREDDLLFITADHGNDPTTPSTDHARECVPLLALGPRVRAGARSAARSTFSDLGATVAEWLGVAFRGRGTSFLAGAGGGNDASPHGAGAPIDARSRARDARAAPRWSARTRRTRDFRVGAALLGGDGSIIDGLQRRERGVPGGHLRRARRGGGGGRARHRAFEAILIATEADDPTPPCGICRQVLVEFSPHLIVVSVTRGGREARWTLAELLPKAFTPHSLDRR